jgi:hypothetical protein
MSNCPLPLPKEPDPGPAIKIRKERQLKNIRLERISHIPIGNPDPDDKIRCYPYVIKRRKYNKKPKNNEVKTV